jgi:hypothetical protein
VDAIEFVRRHPRLFHLAHADAWPTLREHGLLSTATLVRRSSVEDKDALLSTHRPEAVTVDVEDVGPVVIRDQAPLNIAKLTTALSAGMTVQDWLRMLNGMVFLYPDEATLTAFHALYKTQPAVVVELNTRSLVDAYGSLVRLSSINTGATVYVAAGRGRETFRGIKQFESTKKVKEVAVLDGIPDLAKHVVKAEHWGTDGERTAL